MLQAALATIERPPLESTQPASLALTTEEKIRLRQLELTVEKNLSGFIQCGRALLEIRESRLYRERYATFADFCRERFAIARSTADQLCRSTQVFQTLESTLAGSNTPIPENISELALRPISRLPDPELQAQTWRVASMATPKGKTPTHSTTAKIARMVAEAVENTQSGDRQSNGHQRSKSLPARELMFTRPISRLAKIDNFDVNVCLLHVKDSPQAGRIAEACEIVIARCQEVRSELAKKFPEISSNAQPSNQTSAPC
jgi:hypothetical protein